MTQEKKYFFYKDCPHCDGEGGIAKYCCSGFSDGVQDCGCAGQGTFEDCDDCENGKVVFDEIEWDWNSEEEFDNHDYQVYYSIIGKGIKHGESYCATVIYTCGELDEITDIEEYN